MKENPVSMSLKKDIISLMDGMKAFHSSYPKADLPKPSDKFELTRELVSRGEFNIAVCGKVKNGKSSLINALIGKELLPVCNDVATSRVFKISNAEKEQFFVVYANGNKKEITAADLELYGSQAVIDKKGEVSVKDTIAYIQVYTKLEFLPEGVSLIDTPGIGSTYPQHTAITLQYLKMSDAVLFVMNPTPLENIEVDFLKKIADVTPGIIFVTTKTDQNGNDSVDEAVRRNYDIIKNAIGSRLKFDLTILKMSSKLLLDAGMSDNEMESEFNYEISGYDEVKKAINDVVFKILGHYRISLAYNECIEHYNEVQRTLKFRLEQVKKAATEYSTLLAKYEQALKDFRSKMGDNNMKEVMGKINSVISVMEYDFNLIFSPKGNILPKYIEEIEHLSTSEEISTYGEGLGERIVTDIKEEWEKLTSLVQSKVMDILRSFNEECMIAVSNDLVPINTSENADPSLHSIEFRDRFSKIRTDIFLGSSVPGTLGMVLNGAYFFFPVAVAPIYPVALPLLVVMSLGAILWGTISGNKRAEEDNVQKNKTQLLKYVNDVVSNCKKQLIEVSLADDKYKSLYHGFIEALRSQSERSLSELYNKYNSELEAMKKVVVESKQNPQLAVALDHLVKQWAANEKLLQSVKAKLDSIKY